MVTFHYAGTLIKVTDKELVLRDAIWVADSGIFSEALEDESKVSELEPFCSDLTLSRGALVDACQPKWVSTAKSRR